MKNLPRYSTLRILSQTILFGAFLRFAAAQAEAVAPKTPPTTDQLPEILFCSRLPYDDPHWYANIGYYCQDVQQKAYAGNGQTDDGKLWILNPESGELRVLFDAQGGSVRDPQVHYDSRTILFSHRPSGMDHYNLFEIHADGSGLRQITHGPYDDYEAAYLPDGGIVFVSTRCNRWVNCWKTQVGILYRCDSDGQNIHPISSNTEHDNTPWVLPDGRILYTRWEYVDRSQVEYHHLWTMNPDGSAQNVYYGNMHPGIVMIDAKPIPFSNDIVASFSPGHGASDHAGRLTIVSGVLGPDETQSVRNIHQGPLIKDPYPLSPNAFLAARGKEIILMSGSGEISRLLTYQGAGHVHEPRPLITRPRERIIPSRTQSDRPFGAMILSNAYQGRNLDGIESGQIKKLLILESLPKQVNFSGGPDLTSWLGTFTLERVLGTVPVEEDGSAYFEVPAGRQLFFVALDENDLSLKRMQSFTSSMPGEVQGCVGCHEKRIRPPEHGDQSPLLALQRQPSRIQAFEGVPDVLDFQRDIQPILDRYCLECHSYEKREGHLILAGDLGPTWSHAFYSLFAFRQVADGRNGLGNQPPRSIGSSASDLLKKVDGSHYEVSISDREWRTLWLWIESGAPYAGSYAALRNEQEQQLAGASVHATFTEAQDTIQRRCSSCHRPEGPNFLEERLLPFNPEISERRKKELPYPTGIYERIVLENDPAARFSVNILLNYSRPEYSPLLLAPLAKEAGGFESCGAVFASKNDPDYLALLEAIQAGQDIIQTIPRYSTERFRPNQQYVREMKRYGIWPDHFEPDPGQTDIFEADQKYWMSFWHPAQKNGN
jgi:cytochrome c553